MIEGHPAQKGTRDRQVDVRIFRVIAVLAAAGLILAIVGTIYCPTQTWVTVADWLTAAIWVLVFVMGVRYKRRSA